MKLDILSRADWPGLAFGRFVSCAVYSAFFITLFINPASAAAQETGCGSIYGLNQTVTIVDCANPFVVKAGFPLEFFVAGLPVENGDTVLLEGTSTDFYYVVRSAEGGYYNEKFYRHEADSYREFDSGLFDITEDDYRKHALEYFGNAVDGELYVQALFNWDNAYETNPLWDWDVYDGFYAYFSEHFYYRRPELTPGTYTVVVYVGSARYALTFNIATATPPADIPSVLFLPGIMGSRLYEESGECSLFGSVAVRERWFSADGCDIARLHMNEAGESINTIFTDAEDGLIADVGVVLNLYDSLLEDLEDWKENGTIADFRAVPYDWRLRLSDILRAKEVGGRIVFDGSGTYQEGYLYKSLQALVTASPNGKVVLVGHSNGGLVIQALLATMKEHDDPLLEAVEKVVLVAVPQAGAPESVLGLLHGVEVGSGLVISEEESRQLMNTAPFAYHLLPTDDYYDMVETPVIAFEPGTSTDAWIAQFGNNLDTVEEVAGFMKKESGRTTPVWAEVLTPATTHSSLHDYAEVMHENLNDWRPSATAVYEVAGVGVSSPATLTYFTDTKCVRTEPYVGGAEVCVEFGPELGYRVSEVIDGDGTVMAPSALATPAGAGVEKLFLNLFEYNDDNSDRIHKNILEVEDVRSLIADVATGDTIGSYTYLDSIAPNFDGEKRLIYQLHSPLDMYVVLHDGEVVGSSTPILRGVKYSRYGEVQYLSIPEEETEYEVRLVGLATGSFTLDIEQYEGDALDERVTYSALPSSTSTKVSIEVAEDELLDEVDLQIDYEGDGVYETVALPGLGQVTFIATAPAATSTTSVASSTTSVATKSGRTGTKVRERGFALAPIGELSSATIYTADQRATMLRLIELLTQYRDLLIRLKVQ